MMATAAQTDSLQALSGIRIAVGTAIPAVPFIGKANSMTVLGRTHCKRGHALVASNILPDKRRIRRCRACRNISHKQALSIRMPSADKVREAIEALREGKPLTQITHGYTQHSTRGTKNRYEKVGKIIMKAPVLRNFMTSHPVLGRRIQQMIDDNRKASLAATRRIVASPAILKNNGRFAYAAIVQATNSLPDYLRDEVRSLMWMAAAEGKLSLRSISREVVQSFVSKQNQLFSKYIPHGGGIMQSLDQQVYDDGPTRLVDTVTHGLWD